MGELLIVCIDGAALVPAESATAQPAKPARAERSNLTASAPADLAMRVRELAERRGVSVSAIITSALTAYLANV